MTDLIFDYAGVLDYVSEADINAAEKKAEEAKHVLTEGIGEGSEFTGWVDLPVNYDKDEFERIKKSAAKIRSDSDVLIVIGIGGSYLGARAADVFLYKNYITKQAERLLFKQR